MYQVCAHSLLFRQEFLPQDAFVLTRNPRGNCTIHTCHYRRLGSLHSGLEVRISPLSMLLNDRDVDRKSGGEGIPSRTVPILPHLRGINGQGLFYVARPFPQNRRRRIHIIRGPSRWPPFHSNHGRRTRLEHRLGVHLLIATSFAQLMRVAIGEVFIIGAAKPGNLRGNALAAKGFRGVASII